MQSLVILFLLGLANARLSDDKCKEYNKEPLSNGLSLINDFPHMGLLGYRDRNTTRYSCPATLIDVSVAITPGYCIKNSTGGSASAIFGMLNPNKNSDNYKLVDIVETIVHPQFANENPSMVHSIALVKFSPPIIPSDYIRPGCLYSKDVDHGQALIDLLWGRTAKVEDLFKVNSSIVSTSSCQKAFLDTNRRITIDAQSHLCLNRNFHGHYKRHVGGTSHLYEDGVPKIVAIDNFGLTVPRPEIPDVTTKIYTYLDWIEQNAWGKD